MTLFQAFVYFFREAAISLRRGWKVSLLAVMTIATSLFVGGVFLLVSTNLAAIAGDWRDEARIVVYLDPSAEARMAEMSGEIGSLRGIRSVELVTAEEAADRFKRVFPSLAGLLDDPRSEPLPASLELRLESELSLPATETLLSELRSLPGVTMVDDDRDWLSKLEMLVNVVRLVGLGLGVVLLAAAIFTIASVIRLTAYLYKEEIAVMRLVGATELLIRGPFYAEGLLQGLGGGLVALASLFAAHAIALRASPDSVIVREALLSSFLPPAALASMLAVGTLAGLLGAVLSLRREILESGLPSR